MKELKKLLEMLANRVTWNDSVDFDPQDFSGGNFDDAYYGGLKDGSTDLARTILEKFFKG